MARAQGQGSVATWSGWDFPRPSLKVLWHLQMHNKCPHTCLSLRGQVERRELQHPITMSHSFGFTSPCHHKNPGKAKVGV